MCSATATHEPPHAPGVAAAAGHCSNHSHAQQAHRIARRGIGAQVFFKWKSMTIPVILFYNLHTVLYVPLKYKRYYFLPFSDNALLGHRMRTLLLHSVNLMTTSGARTTPWVIQTIWILKGFHIWSDFVSGTLSTRKVHDQFNYPLVSTVNEKR